MTALAINRPTPLPETNYVEYNDPVKGGVHIFAGAAVGVSATTGFLMPMVAGTVLRPRGIAAQEVDATNEADGDLRCRSIRAAFMFHNLGADLVVAGDLEDLCYFQDDQTVAHTSNSAARNAAGRVLDLIDWHGETMVRVAVGEPAAP